MGGMTPEQVERHSRSWPPRSWYATRRSRRTLAAVGTAAVALAWISAIVCWFFAPSSLAMWTTFVLWGAAIAIYTTVYAALVGATRGVIGLAGQHLDERQARERRRLQADAHRGTTIMLYAVLALVLLAVTGAKASVVEVPVAAIVLFAYAMIVTHHILPSLLAAWRMPDPPQDDDEDD
ncbi:hypothetical protein ACFYSC_32145 [Streptosporangium sp. NPDC004379]|uniref:hypothetical protein n=1 Tax=Streptosporangium sp. NPDC004379 TaxID=3366189 RepID=UPI0036C06CB2